MCDILTENRLRKSAVGALASGCCALLFADENRELTLNATHFTLPLGIGVYTNLRIWYRLPEWD